MPSRTCEQPQDKTISSRTRMALICWLGETARASISHFAAGSVIPHCFIRRQGLTVLSLFLAHNKTLAHMNAETIAAM